MASRMKRKFHVRFRAGENLKMTSKDYLSLYSAKALGYTEPNKMKDQR